jgi:transposase
MDYKKVLRLHYVNHLSSRDIAESSNCGKTTVNEFLRRFRECGELSYPLPEDVTNEYIESLLYRKPGASDNQLYRSFDEEAVYKALSRKGETLKHLWQKYNAIGIVDGKKPVSYREYCRRYSEWADSKKLTFHIQRYPGVNLELDYAGKTLRIHNRRNPEETTKVTIFIAALTYSDYFYAEGMIECDIGNWIRVNNNALAFFGGITPTVTPDNCKVAVESNKNWISPAINKDFQAWAEHNGTAITPAKVKSPRWKPTVEGHVKIVTMHILMDMDEMVFYSLEDLNRVLIEKVRIENARPFEGLSYSRQDLFEKEEKESLLPLPLKAFEYLERKTVKVSQDFSFIFDKVHYSMPRKYLKQELEIRAGEKEIYVYNKHGDFIRTHQRSYTPKSWVVIPSDMPAEYKDYGYWNVPYFQHKASKIGPNTRALIDAVIQKSKHPVQSFRSCFGIISCAEKYSPEALELCCKDAILNGKCNYSYVYNTVSMYHTERKEEAVKPASVVAEAAVTVSGRYKDDDSRYSLRSLLDRQEKEEQHE